MPIRLRDLFQGDPKGADPNKNVNVPAPDSKKPEVLPTNEEVIKSVIKNYAARDKCSQIAWELRENEGVVGLGYGFIHDCVVNKDHTDVVASEQSRKIGTAAGEQFYTGYSATPSGKELLGLLGKVKDANCRMPSGLMTEFALKMQMTCMVYGKAVPPAVELKSSVEVCKAWVFEGVTTPEACLKRCTQYSRPSEYFTYFTADTRCQFLENEVPGFVKPAPGK